MTAQLPNLDPPAIVVIDGELAINRVAESIWPDVPIQRCWWHLPRARRWAVYAGLSSLLCKQAWSILMAGVGQVGSRSGNWRSKEFNPWVQPWVPVPVLPLSDR